MVRLVQLVARETVDLRGILEARETWEIVEKKETWDLKETLVLVGP